MSRTQVRPWCMISRGNHVMSARFVLLSVSDEPKACQTCSLYDKTIIRFDFLISRIIAYNPGLESTGFRSTQSGWRINWFTKYHWEIKRTNQKIISDIKRTRQKSQHMAGLQCHAIKNKKRNHSINQVKKLGYERWLIYKQPRQDLDLCGNSFARYLEKCSTQIYRALYGDAMLVPMYMGTNMAAVK